MKSAIQIIDEVSPDLITMDEETREQVIRCMKLYAEQAIDECASKPKEDYLDGCWINKYDILNIKSQLK